MLCNVTGTLYLPNGQLGKSRTLRFKRVDQKVKAEYLGAVVPDDVYTQSDKQGDVDFDVLTGVYMMHVEGGYSVRAIVPDSATANISDIIEAAAIPPEPPVWYQQAINARDEAVDAADTSESAAGRSEAAAEDARSAADDLEGAIGDISTARAIAEEALTEAEQAKSPPYTAFANFEAATVGAASIPADIDTIRTSGYFSPGDGGDATYVKNLTFPITLDGEFTRPSMWTAGSRWVVTGGRAVATPGAGSAATVNQLAVLQPGREYRAEYTIDTVNAGGTRVRIIGGGSALYSGPMRTQVGTYSEVFTAPSGAERIGMVVGGTDTDLSLSYFEVYPVEPDTEFVGPNLLAGGNFDFEGSWTSSANSWVIDTDNNEMTATDLASNQLFRTPDLVDLRLIPGREYEVTFTINGYAGGGVGWRGYSTGPLSTVQSGPARTANGTYTERFTAAAGISSFGFRTTTGGTTLVVRDVSIRPVIPLTHSRIVGADGSVWVLEASREIWVEKLGAIPGRDCTEAFQEALALQQMRGGVIRVGYGTFFSGPIHMVGQVNLVGSGISGLGLGGLSPILDEGTVINFVAQRAGDFWMSRYGKVEERDWFSRFKLVGSGNNSGLMDGGFRFPVTHISSNAPQFHEVGIEQINGWGIWVPYSIRMVFNGGYFRSCGERGNVNSGGGIYMLTAQAHTGRTLAAISGQLNPLDLLSCNYGMRVADGEVATIMTSKEIIAQFNTYAIYAPDSNRWRIADCYFEFNENPSQVGWGSEQGTRKHDDGAGGGDIDWMLEQHVLTQDFERGITRLKTRSGAIQILDDSDNLSVAGSAIYSGTDSPEGVIFGRQGSLYLRRTSSSSNPKLYSKTTADTVNIGWVPVSLATAGSTVARPASHPTGTLYFDTTLGQPIWWDGSAWVDAMGATV